MNLTNASYKPKAKVPTIPADATIIKKETSLRVEEIENGYLVTKCLYLNLEDKEGNPRYKEYEKKYFSEENPLNINEDKMLADNF